ncbi:MAG TPA: CHAD domain-containing protein [Solirubrobacteraceae bacterium]|nr:CHAD domain-containing protein [Solirubrobacteraceae bacterium]
MATKRTAIRRRLAVRSTAHRPPWSGRKGAGHRSIVAPLAATIAATVAFGVGLALVRGGRERVDARRRRAESELGLAPGEPLAQGLRRMALGQIDLALELLGDEDSAGGSGGYGTSAGRSGGYGTGAGAAGAHATGAGAVDEKAVHETRKAIKRLRALLRLLAHELPGKTFARENAALRDTAGRLSGARDAEVMLATLDALIARHPRGLGQRDGVRKLRARVLAERARVERLTLGDPATRAAVLFELRAFRARVATWSLPERGGMKLIEADLDRLYAQGRARYRRVARDMGNQVLAMHEWRKRVKDLRYAAEMLERRGSGKRLRRIARQADALGELLGEDHDLAVLAEHVRAGGRADGRATWRTGRRTRKALLKAIAKRRRKLRRRALRDGERLYRARRKRFVRGVRAAYESGRRASRLS